MNGIPDLSSLSNNGNNQDKSVYSVLIHRADPVSEKITITGLGPNAEHLMSVFKVFNEIVGKCASQGVDVEFFMNNLNKWVAHAKLMHP